jgi:hypothetical protein
VVQFRSVLSTAYILLHVPRMRFLQQAADASLYNNLYIIYNTGEQSHVRHPRTLHTNHDPAPHDGYDRCDGPDDGYSDDEEHAAQYSLDAQQAHEEVAGEQPLQEDIIFIYIYLYVYIYIYIYIYMYIYIYV